MRLTLESLLPRAEDGTTLCFRLVKPEIGGRGIFRWSAEGLWRTYIQLTEAESAFRIHKSDLSLRPIWHQKKERVQAHILVCFPAYVLWKTLAAICKAAGLGDEQRKGCSMRSRRYRLVDVVMPTKTGVEIRRRCVAKPIKHQAILLQRLNLKLPQTLGIAEM